jgi:3-oxoacyl-[acyl-carrier protein] reductase
VTVDYLRNQAGAAEVGKRIEAAGQVALLVQADVRRRDEVARLFREHLARFGGVDILVNNAGDMVKRIPTVETPETVWRDAIDLNLSSAFFCCQEAVGPMVSRAWGRIINISSVGARTGGGPGSIPYHAAKAALMTLTKGLARSRRRNITICRSVSSTPSRSPRKRARVGWIADRAARFLERRACLLASNDASYITGATLDVNGGMAMY